jgi:hypothetical protein
MKWGWASKSPGYQGRHRVKRGCGSSCTAGIGSPCCSSAKWPSSLLARRAERRAVDAAAASSRSGILGFVTTPGGGQVTDWIRCRWWPARISPTRVLGWLSPSASHPTSAVRLRWLNSAGNEPVPVFKTPHHQLTPLCAVRTLWSSTPLLHSEISPRV